jgi:hypothetical protein
MPSQIEHVQDKDHLGYVCLSPLPTIFQFNIMEVFLCN